MIGSLVMRICSTQKEGLHKLVLQVDICFASLVSAWQCPNYQLFYLWGHEALYGGHYPEDHVPDKLARSVLFIQLLLNIGLLEWSFS